MKKGNAHGSETFTDNGARSAQFGCTGDRARVCAADSSPDAYGDPQACAADIPVPKAAVDKGKVGDNGLTPKETEALLVMARACAGDVGGGIAEARTLYNAAVDTEDELKAAEKVYADDDSARNLEKRDEAQEAHDEAVEARNAHTGGGTIYESVFIEEDRLAKAMAASSAFTKAEAAADTAQALRDTVELENYITDFAGFDATGQAYEFETYTVLTTKAIPADGNTPQFQPCIRPMSGSRSRAAPRWGW